uniref:Uncharacterized protein n=1 Tax=Glossina palpalis gambiensis TaxID=67801 RepID=A0A1B0BSB5_9MUSC
GISGDIFAVLAVCCFYCFLIFFFIFFIHTSCISCSTSVVIVVGSVIAFTFICPSCAVVGFAVFFFSMLCLTEVEVSCDISSVKCQFEFIDNMMKCSMKSVADNTTTTATTTTTTTTTVTITAAKSSLCLLTRWLTLIASSILCHPFHANATSARGDLFAIRKPQGLKSTLLRLYRIFSCTDGTSTEANFLPHFKAKAQRNVKNSPEGFYKDNSDIIVMRLLYATIAWDFLMRIFQFNYFAFTCQLNRSSTSSASWPPDD